LEVVKHLIESGADINRSDEVNTPLLSQFLTTTKNGSTALMLASENGQLEVVKYLIESGADIHHQTNVRF
jgi:ankyrin repeat protein